MMNNPAEDSLGYQVHALTSNKKGTIPIHMRSNRSRNFQISLFHHLSFTHFV